MKIGIISDSHDNLPLIGRAVHYLNDEWPVDAVIHAGDYVAPFAVRELARIRAPLYGVFGNNDGERAGIRKELPQIEEPPLRFQLGGRTIVVTHDLATLAEDDTAGADIIVCGHTHAPEVKQDSCLLVNPGELGAWLTGTATIAVVDLETLEAQIVTLADA